jgi:plastocyanin
VIRHLQRTTLGLGLGLLPLLAFAGVAPVAADTATQSASINISDAGYSPNSVTIFQNGTVSFTNTGTIVHTATTTGASPLPFDTGGLDPSKSTSFNLSLPGTYPFNSATDCLSGNNSAQFKCGGGSVIVVASSAPAGAAPAPAAPAPVAPPPPGVAPAPAAPAGSSQSNAVVTITDKGVTPDTVTVALGGSVTWVNQSSAQVHTATTNGTTPVPFDTGGLGPGQSGTLSFATPGTYTYNSATDCGSQSNPAGFGCGPYTVVVGTTPGAPAPATGTSSSASPLPVVANTNVTIDDVNGFTPNTLTIRAGQTVVWTNTGSNVHTASSNQGYNPAFDSGGMAKGQKFSQVFNNVGTFGYHSQTEPVYTTDPSNPGNVTVVYQFNGTIVVQ